MGAGERCSVGERVAAGTVREKRQTRNYGETVGGSTASWRSAEVSARKYFTGGNVSRGPIGPRSAVTSFRSNRNRRSDDRSLLPPRRAGQHVIITTRSPTPPPPPPRPARVSIRPLSFYLFTARRTLCNNK